jgi:hypothetical protein
MKMCAYMREMRGVSSGLCFAVPGGGQEVRFGCEFGSFFSSVDGATPEKLLKRGIYSEIAVALKGGPWREASMAMLAMALGLSKEQAEAQAEGQDVLGAGLGFAESFLDRGLAQVWSGLDKSVKQASDVANAGVRRVRISRSPRGPTPVSTSTELSNRAKADAVTVSMSAFEVETGEESGMREVEPQSGL